MDLFRRKQKLIFWIVTIIIVPSFVLVWGVDRYGSGAGGANYEVGQVNGAPLKYPEFEGFQKRLRAAIGGLPLQIDGAPGAGTQVAEIYKYLFAYSMLKDAEAAGAGASDLQVGTYIDNSHPVTAEIIRRDGPGAREKAVDTVCRQMQVSRPEFLRGVREWLSISNYLQADSNLSPVNDDTVFAFYSLNKAECVIKRILFPETDGLREAAKLEITQKPAEELETEIRDYAETHSDRQVYREPAGWRFAYVFVPFVAADTVLQPTDAEISERYEQGKAYLYNNQPLDAVRERIRSELLTLEVERQTIRNVTVDVDPQLRAQVKDMNLEELVKLTPLIKHNVAAGDTGPELLPAAEVAKKLPQGGGDAQFALMLDSIDSEDPAMRDQLMEEWKSGFNLATRPFKADNGFYRMQLLEYEPSTPAAITDADGKIRPNIYQSALADIVSERAAEMARRNAEEMESKLRDYFAAKERGEPVPDPELAAEFEAMPTETIGYLQIADSNYALGRLPVGELMGPQPYRDPETGRPGQEIIVMVERLLPTREDFAAEPEATRFQYHALAAGNYQGRFGFTPGLNGISAIIHPSPAILAGLADRFNKGQIRVNPDMLGN